MCVKFNIGEEFFRDLREGNCYYADKTEILYELIEESPSKVTLFTRPRRFGKTLMLDMIENFFNITKDSQEIFKGLNITKHKEFCDKYMNKYPVIFISLKEVEGYDFESAYKKFAGVISKFCKSVSNLIDNEKINDNDRDVFKKLETMTADRAQITSALDTLMRMLYTIYGKKVIVLIDEYDVPISKAYNKDKNDYYPKMVSLIREFLNEALKTNQYLQYGLLTGCLRISKESIFTGVNNFKTYSILNEKFSSYFGFTENEVKDILAKISCSDKLPVVKEWYDGYIFGDNHMYCPWDVINYAADLSYNNAALPQNYWQNTSSNDVIAQFIDMANDGIKLELEGLLNGGTVTKNINDNLNYELIKSNINNIYTVLFTTGYLTKADFTQGTKNIRLKIPNKEITDLFESQVLQYFEASLDLETPKNLIDALWDGDVEKAMEYFNDLLMNTISYHDYGESYYHAFLTGVLSKVNNYEVKSNMECGTGRADIVIRDYRKHRAMIIETKFTKDAEKLNEVCDEAIAQIDRRNYESTLNKVVYPDVICFGIACFEKMAIIKMK